MNRPARLGASTPNRPKTVVLQQAGALRTASPATQPSHGASSGPRPPWWRRVSLAFRLMFAFSIVSGLVLVATLAVLRSAYERDKLAYVMDLVALRRDALVERARSFAWIRPKERGEKEREKERGEKARIDGAQLGAWMKSSIEENALVAILDAGGKPVWKSRAVDAALDPTVAEMHAFYRKSGLAAATSRIERAGAPPLRTTIVSFSEVPEMGVVVYYSVAFDDITEPLRRLSGLTLILGLACVMLGSIGLVVVLHVLFRPLRQVEAAAEAIGQGRYDVRFAHADEDEFTRIFQSLDRMASLLRSRDASLRRAARDVERVAAATRAMAGGGSASDLLRIALEALAPLLREDGTQGVAIGIVPGPSFAGRPQALPTGLGALATPVLSLPFDPSSATRLHERKILVQGKPVADGVIFSLDGAAKPDLRTLVSVFEGVVASLQASLEAVVLQRQQLEAIRVQGELEAGRAVQEALVVVEPPVLGCDVAHYYESANRTGGDVLLAFFDESERRLVFFVGDVTGHGVSSALVSAEVVGILRGWHHVWRHAPLEEFSRAFVGLMSTVDRVIWESARGKLSLTLAAGWLDIHDGALRYVNMGHPWPILMREGGKTAVERKRPDRALGKDGDLEVTLVEDTLPPGGSLFVYTDGLTDVVRQGPQFGVKQIRRILEDDFAGEARTCVGRIVKESRERIVEGSDEDDVTLLLVRMPGAGGAGHKAA